MICHRITRLRLAPNETIAARCALTGQDGQADEARAGDNVLVEGAAHLLLARRWRRRRRHGAGWAPCGSGSAGTRCSASRILAHRHPTRLGDVGAVVPPGSTRPAPGGIPVLVGRPPRLRLARDRGVALERRALARTSRWRCSRRRPPARLPGDRQRKQRRRLLQPNGRSDDGRLTCSGSDASDRGGGATDRSGGVRRGRRLRAALNR